MKIERFEGVFFKIAPQARNFKVLLHFSQFLVKFKNIFLGMLKKLVGIPKIFESQYLKNFRYVPKKTFWEIWPN